VGTFEGGRIVDAVPGHRHPCAACLQTLHQTQLVGRAGTREYRGDTQTIIELRIAEAIELGSGEWRLGAEPEALCDGRGCRSVVAGDHLHCNPGTETFADGSY